MNHPDNFDSEYSKYFVSYIDYSKEIINKNISSLIKVLRKTFYSGEAKRKIEEEVKAILRWRGTEDGSGIAKRARSAADEVLDAVTGAAHYDRIIQTSPEGRSVLL